METLKAADLPVNDWPTLDGESPVEVSSPEPAEDEEWEEVYPENSFEKEMVVVQAKYKSNAFRPLFLRQRSSSTPDLRALGPVLEVVQEDDSVGAARKLGTLTPPPTAVLKSSLVTNVPSFADMVRSLQSEVKPAASPAPTSVKSTTQSTSKKPRQRARYVVTPIRRCSKSTGDLKSLASSFPDDDHNAGMDEMDYYHRKSQGAVSRKNGLKLRPDEAKRKNISMYKKELQRQQQRNR
mmetsp:Transcript_36177/g.53983  ORF Transcript_36177/g.53983 Transcript_36177/m.53983 type:complete len:238 (-) Transcript_36177:96-809(-)|eukprot:CAMPEP_0194069506 /NCGR_PEP_ID=MMETSP0009_2-20130614/87675_1 /TAXON_ID=210454 /ORGANISM="Grammatophora oceanica, Strain CCMP 410" /LENGTH=237 /DNA_ID=CAMNT_0038722697 /DNA_START=181 /DNA_END=894 /DNA_ORIENTATION=-